LSETEWARLLAGVTGFAENPTGQMRVIRFSQLVGEYDLPIHRSKASSPQSKSV
jgi:hypothetical protein